MKARQQITSMGGLPGALHGFLSPQSVDVAVDTHFIIYCKVGMKALAPLLVWGADRADLLFVSVEETLKRLAPRARFRQTLPDSGAWYNSFTEAIDAISAAATGLQGSITTDVRRVICCTSDDKGCCPAVELLEGTDCIIGLNSLITRLLDRRFRRSTTDAHL
jgi:hypothetical protein